MNYTPSVRELALREIVALLGAQPMLTQNVFRSQLDQIEQSQLPCYDVTPGDMKVAEGGRYADFGSVTNTQDVTVRALVNAGTAAGESATDSVPVDDSSLDAFLVFAEQQLIGTTANLGGLVQTVELQSVQTVFQPNGQDIIGLEMIFQLTFATKRGDPTQRG